MKNPNSLAASSQKDVKKDSSAREKIENILKKRDKKIESQTY